MIYLIKFNTWTGTYYVYRRGQPVMLTRQLSKPVRDFIYNSKCSFEGEYKVYRMKEVK